MFNLKFMIQILLYEYECEKRKMNLFNIYLKLTCNRLSKNSVQKLFFSRIIIECITSIDMVALDSHLHGRSP